MQNQHSRDFQGIWIPIYIWHDKRLTPFEKILLVTIGHEGWLDSDKELCEVMNCSMWKLKKAINKFNDLCLLELINVPPDGRQIYRVINENYYVAFARSFNHE